MSDSTIPHNVHEIPGPARFVARGQSFELPLLDTIYRLHDVAEEVRAAGGSHRAYLFRVIQHVQAETGVELSFGEADYLNDQLEIELAAAKKKRRDSYAAALTSPSSTASTPAD